MDTFKVGYDGVNVCDNDLWWCIVVIDSGSSLIHIGEQYWDAVMAPVIKDKNCKWAGDVLGHQCTGSSVMMDATSFPDLHFNFGGGVKLVLDVNIARQLRPVQ